MSQEIPPIPSPITLRAVRPDDAPAIAEMAHQPLYRRNTLRPPFQSVEATRRWIEGLGRLDLSIVAQVEGRVVGSAGLRRFEGRRGHCATLGIGVHDGFHGRGIGRTLMAALIDAADNWLDLRRVELTVFTDNAPAIALYRAFGFEDEGVLRGFAFREGADMDVLAMARLRGR